MNGEYVCFKLAVSYSSDKTQLLVSANSDIGSASETVEFTLTQDLNTWLRHFAKAAGGCSSLESGELQEFGSQLFNCVFQSSIKELFRQTKMMVSTGVRIDLQIEEPELSNIPWELIHDGTSFLALSPKTPVIRCTRIDDEHVQPNGISRPVQILFAGAKPWGKVPLKLGGQLRRICQALREGIADGSVILHPALGEEV